MMLAEVIEFLDRVNKVIDDKYAASYDEVEVNCSFDKLEIRYFNEVFILEFDSQ